MIEITHDAEADAVYRHAGTGRFDHTEKAAPFIYDVDPEGRVIGIEILFVSKVLAPGPLAAGASTGLTPRGYGGTRWKRPFPGRQPVSRHADIGVTEECRDRAALDRAF